MKAYTPIHKDRSLDNGLLLKRGLIIGKDAFYNAIRDGSGRFDGYMIPLNGKEYLVKSVAELDDVSPNEWVGS